MNQRTKIKMYSDNCTLHSNAPARKKKLKDFNGHELAQTPGGGKEQGEKGWSAAVHGVTKSWI